MLRHFLESFPDCRDNSGRSPASPARARPGPETDPYLVPAFPWRNRARRAAWNLCQFAMLQWSPRPLFKWRGFVLRQFGARLGSNVFIYPTCRIWAPWLLQVDDVATLAGDCEVYNPAGVHVSHHAIVSQGAYLCGASHDFQDPAFPLVARPICIEPYAWICARAMVLLGVTVGEGAVLAAGAVAAKDLEPWTVYAGNPAQPIKSRRRTFPPVK